MGRSDPLEVASLLVLAAHLTPVEAYEAVSAGARHAMALPAVAVDIGSPADFLAVRADSIRHALATASLDRMVFRGEELVATTTSSEWIRGVNQSLDPR
ncbi:MAG: hypothetical protein ACT4OP_00185 [Actinomycetota bacterium]